MIEKFKRLLRSSAGIYIGIGVLVIGLIGVYVSARSSFDNGFEDANSRMYFDENGKLFRQKLVIGSKVTGFPAEACLWNADGSPKKEPTWVWMNTAKHQKEPTFCPDCGRLVLIGNPVPVPTESPPPTKQEYEKDPKKYPLH